jgi:TolB-like protein/tetratricopeptide (TPR) repeat protein/predicted Ser/Thr protein kinase
VQPGARLGAYEIVRLLGAGGMGEVFLARDTRLGREVALKVLPAAFAADPVRRRLFEDEARAVAALNHPSIVTLYAIESVGGVDFLTMEFVDGETLDRLAGPSGLALPRALEIARALAAAVAAAHRRGVVHRDLKPANVMIDREGRLKVLDFGIASRQLAGAEEDAPTRTATGMVAGTISYMAPERLAGRPSGPEADVFSLGVLLHELIAGRRPFSGTTPAEIASSILRDPPAPLDAPPGLARIVARCLEKDPRARYASAEPLARELEQVELDAGPVPAAAPALGGRSIAVASFESLAADPATDWLGVGLAETLTVELRRVAGLQVSGRDRAVALAAESGGDPVRFGRALGVAWIVTGRYQVSGPAVRVTAELHEVASGRVAAAIKIDGALAGIFTLQDELVGRIVSTLDAELSGAGLVRATPATAAAAPVDAFELYARARERVNAMSPASLAEARGLFERAIAASPGWALPHGGLGQLHAMRFIATTDRTELETAVRLLQRACELDPDYVEPLTWLTYSQWRLGRYDEAERTGQSAVARDPGEPLAHYFLGVAWLGRGQDPGDRARLKRSIEPLAEAVRLAPRFGAAQILLGSALLHCGRYEEARAPLEAAAAIERTKRYELSRFVGSGPALALLALREGRLEDAIGRAESAIEQLAAEDHVYAQVSVLVAHRTAAEAALRAGRPGEAAALLHRLRERAAAQPRALGAGWLVARAEALATWAFRDLGLRAEEQRAREGAERGLARSNGYDFSWHWEGGPAAIQVDLALAAAAIGRAAEAFGWLERAAAAGWADARRLDEDPLLEGPRAREGFAALRATVAG